jgi:zinc protease
MLNLGNPLLCGQCVMTSTPLTQPYEAAITSTAVSSKLRCQREVLDNGLVVLVTENPGADIIAARLFMDAGGRHEQPHQAGLSHLVASLLTKGSQNHTAQSIAEQVESTGASFGVDSASDYFLVSLKTISDDFASMLQLAAELIQTPIFPESELELERKLTLQSIRSQQEQPMAIALQQLRQALYQTHPYGQSGLGTLETVAQFTQADLIQFHAQSFRPDTTILSIAGNITLEQALPLVHKVLGPWQSPLTVPLSFRHGWVDPAPSCCTATQKTQQSIVMLGYPAPAVHEPDYPALRLLSTYLWNGLSSRLFTELREKRGLAYEVSGLYPTRWDRSHFVAYLGTAADNTAIALALLQAELDRLSDQPLPEVDIAVTKRKLLGQYALGKQTNHQIAHLMGWYEVLGLGLDYDQTFTALIQSLTSDSVHQAALRHLRQPFQSLVGPEAAIA